MKYSDIEKIQTKLIEIYNEVDDNIEDVESIEPSLTALAYIIEVFQSMKCGEDVTKQLSDMFELPTLH